MAWVLTAAGLMRWALVPEYMDAHDLVRSFVVGRYWLTKREWRVALVLVQGKTRRQMAAALNMSEDAVSDNLSRLYDKLGVQNEKEACALLGQAGVGGIEN